MDAQGSQGLAGSGFGSRQAQKNLEDFAELLPKGTYLQSPKFPNIVMGLFWRDSFFRLQGLGRLLWGVPKFM